MFIDTLDREADTRPPRSRQRPGSRSRRRAARQKQLAARRPRAVARAADVAGCQRASSTGLSPSKGIGDASGGWCDRGALAGGRVFSHPPEALRTSVTRGTHVAAAPTPPVPTTAETNALLAYERRPGREVGGASARPSETLGYALLPTRRGVGRWNVPPLSRSLRRAVSPRPALSPPGVSTSASARSSTIGSVTRSRIPVAVRFESSSAPVSQSGAT